MNEIMLSIVCVTYNHASYIKQALDGFLMQKTNFAFEVLINDDASTDGTTEIIKEYEAKYPDIIKPIYQKENQFSKGVSIAKNFIYPRIKGKYVALCEGDDYWTDPYKLQKQVDFLEAHPECSTCFHPVEMKWEDHSLADRIIPPEIFWRDKTFFTFDELTKSNFIQTTSAVYRWRFHEDSLDLIPNNILPGDWFLSLLQAEVGKIGFLPDVMAVYRKNSGGIWYGAGQDPKWFLKMYVKRINFCRAIEKQFEIDFSWYLYSVIYPTYYASVLFNRNDVIADLQNRYAYLKRPPDNLYILKLEILVNKIICKLLPENMRYKQKRKALKLYLKWKKDNIRADIEK